MFVHMGDTDHIHVHWLSPHHQSGGVSLAPAPAVLVEACGTSSECVEHFPLRQTFSKCPFFPQPLHIASTALQSCTFLVSTFPTSVASVLWEWKLLTLLHWVLELILWPLLPLWLLGPRLCGTFLPFLPLVDFSILDVISPLQSLAFCPNDAVWRLPAWLSPLLGLVSLYVPLSQSWP